MCSFGFKQPDFIHSPACQRENSTFCFGSECFSNHGGAHWLDLYPKDGIRGLFNGKISFAYIPAFSYSAGAIKISEQPRSIICLLIASICLLPLCWSSNWTGISQQVLLFITIGALISIYIPSNIVGNKR